MFDFDNAQKVITGRIAELRFLLETYQSQTKYAELEMHDQTAQNTLESLAELETRWG